eukprot:5737880-Amphidinium_carterae.1
MGQQKTRTLGRNKQAAVMLASGKGVVPPFKHSSRIHVFGTKHSQIKNDTTPMTASTECAKRKPGMLENNIIKSSRTSARE